MSKRDLRRHPASAPRRGSRARSKERAGEQRPSAGCRPRESDRLLDRRGSHLQPLDDALDRIVLLPAPEPAALLKRRSTWIVALFRTPSTGKSDSRIRSPLSSMIPARERAVAVSRRFTFAAVALTIVPARARRRRTHAGARPARCPRRRRYRGSRLCAGQVERSNRRPRSPRCSSSTLLRLPASRARGNASLRGRPIISATRRPPPSRGCVRPLVCRHEAPSRGAAISSTSGRRWLT